VSDDSRSPLSVHTTLGLGGPARHLTTVTSVDEIVSGVRECVRDEQPLLLLGGGSNVVIGDDGFPGTVLLIRSHGWEVTRDGAHVSVTVQAGQVWDEFVLAMVEQGFSGLECLSGIPGAVGGTPIQNVGAYGQEVSETLTSVTVYDRDEGGIRRFTNEECLFEYRHSRFKRSERWVVLDVTFRLRTDPLSGPVAYSELARKLAVPPGERVPLTAARQAVLELRRGKGMVLDPGDPDTRSAGSFFTNPLVASGYPPQAPAWPMPNGVVKVSAAWLIENAGFQKGYRRGPAAISSKHTLALTNPGHGSTKDLLGLAGEIRDGVFDRFGITLHPEVVLVNCTL
jgi:UDP-N-acetylmuramate dehydrogenase